MQLHVGFQALHYFIQNHKRNPDRFSEEDFKEFLKFAEKVNESLKNKIQKFDENLFRILIRNSNSELAPIVKKKEKIK